MIRQRNQLGLVSIVALLAMTLWFSASAVLPQLSAEWQLSGGQQAWLTMSVQLGFVVGALISALVNLADRVSAPRLIAGSAILGAIANAWLVTASGPSLAIALRIGTGIALAGVYPPAMKLAASWSLRSRGLAIGLVVGALSVGSALPHLLSALPFAGGLPPWRVVVIGASGLAIVAAVLAFTGLTPGPHLGGVAPFALRHAARALGDPPSRLVNLGYLGHMWELYAMWTWVPVFLIDTYARHGWSEAAARVAGFGTIAIGGLGCIAAGVLADRLGRTFIVIASLGISGTCALLAGTLAPYPGWLTVLCLVWGGAVVADSAQFSAAASELADRRYVGTALTVQTCLGFLLTMVSIRLLPAVVASVGWRYVFALLAVGPAVGIIATVRLRGLPASRSLADGRR